MILIPQYRTARRASAVPASGGSISFLQYTENTANATTYTFSSQNLGTAAADRCIIVAIQGRASSVQSISAVTVAGVSATVYNLPSANLNFVSIAIAAVPTGTSGDIVVTASGAALRCTIGVYRATGIDPTAHNSGSDVSGAISFALDVAADGVAVVSSCASSASLIVLAPYTEDYSVYTESVLQCAAAGANTPSDATETITANLTAASTLAVSWGPA